MWKCAYRGLRGSLLKVDQSNGGCIVSTIISKDIDELSPQSNAKNKCSCCGDDGFGNNTFRGKHATHHEQPYLVQGSNKDIINDSPPSSCNIFPLPSHAPSLNTSDLHNGSTKTNDGHSIAFHNCEKPSRSVTLLSCRKCHNIYEGNLKCACFSKPHQISWLSKKLGAKSHDTSSVPVPKSALLKHSGLKPLPSDYGPSNFGLLEESKRNVSVISCNFDSPSPKLCGTSSSRLSLLPPNHSIKEKESSNLPQNNASSSSSESQSCQKSSYCLLKLPFLSYNLVRRKGLHRFSACWLNKSKTEFGRDDNKDQGSDGKGESEEAKENTWRHYHIHQSLLEAIGWSSALLLGWYLAQCRIWRLCGKGRNKERKEKAKEKTCIAGMVGRLLFSGKSDSHQFLKVHPSKLNEGIKAHEKEEKFSFSGNEVEIVAEPCNGGSEGYFSDPFIRVSNLKEEGLSNDFSVLPQSSEAFSEASKYPRNHPKEQIPLVNEVNTNRVIPMPWHAKQRDELPFGPKTLEEAAKEAGKGLEEAQAEILLLLALEKLDEGENASHLEPSAVELLDSAAHFGSTAAAFNLGICYEMGVGGVTKDLTRAYYWYKRASDDGHAGATYNLAVFHAQGLAGLHPNTQLAHQLLKRASLLGQPEATDALALLNSIKPSENHDLKDDSVKKTSSSTSQQSADVELSCNSASWEGDDIQAAMSSSDISFVSNGSDASKSTVDSSLEKKSRIGWSKTTYLKLGHLMESFCIPFYKPNETEDSLADVLLDNTLSVNKSNFDHVSAISYAQ